MREAGDLEQTACSEDLGEFLDVRLVENEGLAHRGLAIVADLGFAHAAHLQRLIPGSAEAPREDIGHDLVAA